MASIVRGRYLVVRVIDAHSAEIIRDGALYERDGQIIEVGRYEDISLHHAAHDVPVIGSDDHIVLPGLINGHHHTGLTPFQLGTLDLPLEIWRIDRWSARDCDMYLDTLACAIQMLESGITTVIHNQPIWGLSGSTTEEALDVAQAIVRAYQDAGMRVAFSYAYRDQNRLVYEDDEEFLATLPWTLAGQIRERLGRGEIQQELYFEVFDELNANYRSDIISYMLSAISVPRCSEDFLLALRMHADQHDMPIHIHLQETVYERLYTARRFGKTSLAYLEEMGFLGPEVCCAHGVWLTESDINILQSTGTSICHNASSNLRLKSGIAPVNRLLAAGVTMALGLDEAGINDDNDMLQEMRLAHKLHRVPGIDSDSPTSHQVLQMATEGGAKVAGFTDNGTLRVGNRADVTLLRLSRIGDPYLDAATDVIDALLYRAKVTDVDVVIVDGVVVVRDGHIVGVDKGGVLSDLKQQLAQEPQPGELARKNLARALLPHVVDFYRRWSVEHMTPHYFYNATS